MAPGTIACCTGGREHSATVHGRATALAEATGAGLVFVPDLHLTEGRPRAIRARLPPDVFLVVRTAACPRSFGAPASDYDRGWLRALPCSVWVMPAYDGPQRRVVVAAVGLDGEGDFPLDVEVLSAAETIAQVEDAHLVVVHAWSLIGESIINCPVRGLGPRRGRRILRQMRQEREEMLKSFVEAAREPWKIHVTVAKGPVFEVIEHTLARTGAGTLVLGHRSHSGFWGALSRNVTERFAHAPGFSVLAIRPGHSLPTVRGDSFAKGNPVHVGS